MAIGRMTFELEYLGKFIFIFENKLGSESGDQMDSFDEQNQRSKISCNWPFKQLHLCQIEEESRMLMLLSFFS